MFLRVRQAGHLADGFLFGKIADAASVKQDNIGIGFPAGNAVPAFAQQRRDGFAVAHVHLAAVGFDENFFHHAGCRP